MDEPFAAVGWAFDLVSPEAARRRAALDRHRATMEASNEAQQWINRVWAEAGTPVPQGARLGAELDQALAAKRDADALTFFAPLGEWWADWPIDAVKHARYAAYAVLFLEWEAKYPLEWREAGSWSVSPWGTKESVLARFIRGGVPDEVKQPVADLVVVAVAREYRCKDWMYAAVAHRVDGSELRSGLARLLGAGDPLVRLRAEFVLDLLDQRRPRVRRTTWKRWLAGSGDPM